MTVYLDSSAILKRYVSEDGSEVVSETYEDALAGEYKIAFSAWNIGEVLGVLDRYHRRGWLVEEDYKAARTQFIGETLRFLRLGLVKIIPVKTRLLISSWSLVEKYHMYQADALQVVSAKYMRAQKFLTGDRRLAKIAADEGLKSIYLG